MVKDRKCKREVFFWIWAVLITVVVIIFLVSILHDKPALADDPSVPQPKGFDGDMCAEWINRTTEEYLSPSIDRECCYNTTCDNLQECYANCDSAQNGQEKSCYIDCRYRDFTCEDRCSNAFMTPENIKLYSDCIIGPRIVTKTERACVKKIPYYVVDEIETVQFSTRLI